MKLFINGFEIENVTKVIAQTKQVNDIVSLATRQANYTNSFAFPKTANNQRAFDLLGQVGNQSNVPYQKNECYLFSDSGECFVFKGWAVITETGNDYKCAVYDGNIDIYKSIENLNLNALDLSEITHDKTVSNVVDSWNDLLPYKYILADFNGKPLYDTNKINIDYLAPCVRASYLWEKLENLTGIELNGTFKTNPDFINLWLSFPKGTPDELIYNDIFISTDLVNVGVIDLIVNSYTLLDGLTLGVDNKTFTALRPMTIEINLVSDFYAVPTVADINLYKNGTPYKMGQTTGGGLVNTTYKIRLEQGDIFYIGLGLPNNVAYILGGFNSATFKEAEATSISFIDEFENITVKEFFTEIVVRFGLTLFKSKYENVYTLKTIDEIIDTTQAVDWSRKFITKDNETYLFGSYTKFNYFRYRYNAESQSYNDGIIGIDNENLSDKRDVFTSKITSPERSKSDSLGFTTNVYKLWDKDIQDDGTVKYKGLSGKFYLMRSNDKDFGTTKTIGSEQLISDTTFTEAPVESFSGLDFADTLTNNYRLFGTILNKSKIVTASIWLNDTDVCDIDFSKLVYIEQLGGYFILNKISNFVPQKATKVELININFEEALNLVDYDSLDYEPLDYLA